MDENTVWDGRARKYHPSKVVGLRGVCFCQMEGGKVLKVKIEFC
jgi:hypothetical protein